ncbi:hypothetical protein BGX27_001992 [Mortierella sp. AM989]|nr:hypothetical protein BGX27_001992 [Mortierella sp. AM989]
MVLINYCIRQSKTHHPLFVEPVIACLPALMVLHPEAALQVFHRTAFTPISKNMAQFVRKNRVLPCDNVLTKFFNMCGAPLKIWANPIIWDDVGDNGPHSPKMVPRPTASQMFTLEYFENKSLAAVIEFYWNDTVRTLWVMVFNYKIITFGVILKTTFMQIFDPESPISMMHSYHIAIVFFSVVNLGNETNQAAIGGIRQYLSSIFNWFDMATIILPMITSIESIDHYRKDPTQPIGRHSSNLTSFMILIVYIQLIFELRVIKSFCNMATIILSIIGRIAIFFIIFLIAIVGFAHAFMHLIHTHYKSLCDPAIAISSDSPSEYCSRAPVFPTDFLGAISTTYFFLGGRYDAVLAEMDGKDWAFHMLLALFFFLTAVLMLNIVIALMNSVYTDREHMGTLIWLQDRMRDILCSYVMDYQYSIDSDPRHIYFVATDSEVKKYYSQFLVDLDVHDESQLLGKRPVALTSVVTPVIVPNLEEQDESHWKAKMEASQEEMSAKITSMQEMISSMHQILSKNAEVSTKNQN